MIAGITDMGLGSWPPRADLYRYLVIACGVLVIMGALLYQARQSRRKPKPAEPKDPTMTPEEKRIRDRQNAWTEGLKMLAWAAVLGASILAKDGSGSKDITRYIEYAVAFLGPIVVAAAFRKRLAPYERQTPDASLTHRVQALIAGTGTVIRDVGIDEGLAGRRFSTVVRKRDSIVVARKAMDSLSADELDFLMVRAAVAKGDDLSASTVIAIVLGIASVIGWVLLLARENGGAGPDAMWVWVSYPVMVGALGLYWLVKRNWGCVARDDARALRLTRNYGAAISALGKFVVRKADSKEDLKPEALTRTRIANLVRTAYDLGLSIPETDSILAGVGSVIVTRKDLKA